MFPAINKYIEQYGHIPFMHELQAQVQLSDTEAATAITDAITELASAEKSKGSILFKRFFENDSALFWEFRALNSDKKNCETAMFHELGEQVQNKLRYLEQILTDKMIKRDTDKTVTAFYDHVRLFFPYFDKIGLE